MNDFKSENKLLSIEGIKRLNLAKLAYKFYYTLMPIDMNRLLQNQLPITLRQSNRLKKIKVNIIKNIYSNRKFSTIITMTWNDAIKVELKKKLGIKWFAREYKKYLVDTVF